MYVLCMSVSIGPIWLSFAVKLLTGQSSHENFTLEKDTSPFHSNYLNTFLCDSFLFKIERILICILLPNSCIHGYLRQRFSHLFVKVLRFPYSIIFHYYLSFGVSIILKYVSSESSAKIKMDLIFFKESFKTLWM